MGSEKKFENQVKEYLKSKNIWFIKYWGGATFTKSGIPDILACINGLFVGIELKATNGVLSELQKYQISKIRESNGIAFALYPQNFDKFKKLVEEMLKCNNLAIQELKAINNAHTNLN